jgi:hypothetical protein
MIVVISEPIRQLRDYFDDRRQAIYTDQQTGSSSYFPVLARYLKVCIKSGIPRPALFIVDNKDEMEIEIKVIDLLQGR